MKIIGMFLGLILVNSASATPLWTEGRPTPIDGLSNPYDLSDQELARQVRAGRLHVLNYPVEETGLLFPYEPMKRALNAEGPTEFKKWLQEQIQNYTNWESFDDFTAWAGLHEYPLEEGEGPYFVPFKSEETIKDRMGVTVLNVNGTKGFTISCAVCHSSNLFGRPIIGLTNRFPRANEMFNMGQKGLRKLLPSTFQLATGATWAERKMYAQSRLNIKYVEPKLPVLLGLDTSLAHTALALSHRKPDEYASKDWFDPFDENSIIPPGKGRKEKLRHFVADSKPANWWGVKYKNRWGADGAMISGNPILTNFIWNELGRGSDMKKFEQWFEENQHTIIQELTTAVFNSSPPPMTDFFPESKFDLAKAQRGEVLFESKCSKCHGSYEKAWTLPDAWQLTLAEQFKTIQVKYPEQTPIENVGTDPQRWQGMDSLEKLNDLALSKKYNVVLKAQKGYVPPPLVGVWARWPYFHNNSIPNLCALFTAPSQRPVTYYAGEALDTQRDFDFECNGYPLGENTPDKWKTPEYLYDTTKVGQSNSGHYKKLFLGENGEELHTAEEKSELIHFLQTL